MLNDILILGFSFVLVLPLSFLLLKRLDVVKRAQIAFALCYALLVSVLCFSLTNQMADITDQLTNCVLNGLVQVLFLWLYLYLYRKYSSQKKSLHIKANGFFVFVCISVLSQIINSIINR